MWRWHSCSSFCRFYPLMVIVIHVQRWTNVNMPSWNEVAYKHAAEVQQPSVTSIKNWHCGAAFRHLSNWKLIFFASLYSVCHHDSLGVFPLHSTYCCMLTPATCALRNLHSCAGRFKLRTSAKSISISFSITQRATAKCLPTWLSRKRKITLFTGGCSQTSNATTYASLFARSESRHVQTFNVFEYSTEFYSIQYSLRFEL